MSVVVATYDRPDDLRKCLHCLVNQASLRPIEIIVVDNHPTSGLTAAVVAEFPGVVLVQRAAAGLGLCSQHRIHAPAEGDIVIATDDDVTMPPDWLEKLGRTLCQPRRHGRHRQYLAAGARNGRAAPLRGLWRAGTWL